MPKLTDAVCRALPAPSTGSAIHYDSGDRAVKGFGLRVTANGVRSFIITYRNEYGQQRRFTIGRLGDWETTAARDEAKRLKRAMARGDDPQGKRAADRAEPTVGDIMDRYLGSAAFESKAASTQGTDRGRIERHLRPLLGARIANQLTLEDVKRAFASIRDGKTAKTIKTGKRGKARVTGGAGTARRTIRFLSAIFSWAVVEGLMKTNPARGIQVGKDGKRDLIVEDADAYQRLFAALDALQAEGRFTAAVRDATRVIILTGARKSEIAGLRWRHVDLQRLTITLPSSEHKGRRTGEARTIALPAVAAAIIARQPSGADDDFVFRPAKGVGPVELTKPWRVIRTMAQLDPKIGLHGLRHSAASHLAMAGAAAPEIMVAMGHRDISTSIGYVHFAQLKRAALAERVAAMAVSGLNAAEGKPKADVVDLDG